MLPLHTQKSLDQLTWNEIQKIHASLGLKATATTRTRRDYQRRIVDAQPQPVVEAEQTASALTCATCPLARLIDGNRYCCGLTDTVVRGNWEAKSDCYDAVASQVETGTTEPAAEVAPQETVTETESPIAQTEETPAAPAPIAHQEITATQPELHQVTAQPALKTFNHPFRYRADIFNGQHSFSSATYGLCECDRCVPVAQTTITEPVTPGTVATTTDDAPPNRGDNGRGRVEASTALQAATMIVLPHATKPKADNNFMTAFTKESEGDRKFNDLAYLSQLEMDAQLAIERTVIGSEEEAIAYAHLRKIEQDIEFYNRPEPKAQPSPVIQQLETQMKELKKDVQQLTLDASILSPATNEPEQLVGANESELEGTIYWQDSRLRTGLIVGKKGVRRYFYVQNDVIYVVLNSDFTASERKHPNIHHTRIRQAIEAGKQFNPIAFKQFPEFAHYAENYRDMGWIYQAPDGRWWAWKNGGVTGHPFFDEQTACDYLETTANNSYVRSVVYSK
ncbi:hypothetical protein [Microcoleus sp. T3_D1]|uniref:hypothetical protein n=1 Tax=Microcoleus sp. T3_D1 TaxID=3055427 RepID=UPI002FCFA68B